MRCVRADDVLLSAMFSLHLSPISFFSSVIIAIAIQFHHLSFVCCLLFSMLHYSTS
jgi:hypothetical protein